MLIVNRLPDSTIRGYLVLAIILVNDRCKLPKIGASKL
jgi:hypothetical protein